MIEANWKRVEILLNTPLSGARGFSRPVDSGAALAHPRGVYERKNIREHEHTTAAATRRINRFHSITRHPLL